MAFRGVGTSKPGAWQKFANLLGFLPKPELDTVAGETCIKATHGPALPTPRRKIGADVGQGNIYLLSWTSEKCQVQEVLLPASPLFLQHPSEVSMPRWLQHTGEPQSFPGLRATTAHPGGAVLCLQLIPRPLLTWP